MCIVRQFVFQLLDFTLTLEFQKPINNPLGVPCGNALPRPYSEITAGL